ncbi:immunity protein Imm33 domain-containing protein [Sphingorhabdus sp. Alg231-15]|uniref:immunity protein Imm33 domain-containing protein n=1 Tax=Sphingorhabdus sp. Alg231-15 TaxID=1922222 RepID=UPI00307C7171
MKSQKMKEKSIGNIEFCQTWGAEFVPVSLDCIVGLEKGFDGSKFPINGLRHEPLESTSGWYIWAGETLSQKDEFFEPVHIRHLQKIYPTILEYLGLAEGWRFLIAPDYSDVWFDPSLLNLE